MSADQKWKQNSNKYQSQDHLSVQNLLYKLQDLSEVQDESRNQQCPVFMDQNSISNQNSSNVLQNVLDQEQKNHQSNRFHHQKIESNQKLSQNTKESKQTASNQQNRLEQINQRLVQDNKKLFNQCLRLRKQFILSSHQKEESKFKKNKEQNTTEIYNKQSFDKLLTKFQKTQNQKHDLLKKLKQYKRQVKKQREILNGTDTHELIQTITLFRQQNKGLKQKIDELQKQRQNQKLNRTYSISTTTHDTRSIDSKDRIISNMKIVHQSQIKKLKVVIEEQNKALQKLKFQREETRYDSNINSNIRRK